MGARLEGYFGCRSLVSGSGEFLQSVPRGLLGWIRLTVALLDYL